MSTPDVVVVHLDDCPHWRTALERLRGAMESLGLEGSQIRTRAFSAVDAPADFPGSPTILVDDEDLCQASGSTAPACRRYPSDLGFDGAPSHAAIRAALLERLA